MSIYRTKMAKKNNNHLATILRNTLDTILTIGMLVIIYYRYTHLKELIDHEIMKANSIFDSILKSHEHDRVIAENEKKTIDLQISSARDTLELRKQQNQELNNICQELMVAFNS